MATRCGDTQLDWTLFSADEMAPRAMTPPASTILTLHAAFKDATGKTPSTPGGRRSELAVGGYI